MSTGIRALSDDEVRQIRLIIEALDRSTFDYLQLEFGDVRLTLGRGDTLPETVAAPDAARSPGGAPVADAASAPSVAAAAPPSPVAAEPTSAAGTMAITAPMVGRFYTQPEPGAAPFVSVGSAVTEHSTVALIEVMKTFNAVPAGLRGVITEICVQDAQFVEFGQVLFRVRPTNV